MPNLLQYSNGWGHIIMSVALLSVAVVLILRGEPTLQGVGIALISTVAGYWFVSSSANAVSKNPPAPAPAAAPLPSAPGGTA